MSSRILAGSAKEKRKPPALYRGLQRYSVLSASPDVSNHHLNLLLAQRFIFRLRDRLEPLGIFAIWAFPCELGANFANSNALFGCTVCYTRNSIRLNKAGAEWLSLFTNCR